MNFTRRFTFVAGFALIAAIAAATTSTVDRVSARPDDVPKGVEILLPRGGIPAVFQPEFVSADDAEISDDAWILGVFFNGEAKAYSLNMLNHHEIVNDDFGGHPLAAVW